MTEANTTTHKPIRVGMLQMDTHSMFFGPLMQKHDPVLYRDPIPRGNYKKRSGYGWLGGGMHYYLYSRDDDPTHFMRGGPYLVNAPEPIPLVPGFEIIKIWDQDIEIAEVAARVFYGKPTVCANMEDVSDDVDVVMIGNCSSEGKNHRELATPGLRKGVPTFVDKPFSYHLEDAKAIVQLAIDNNTQVLSAAQHKFNPVYLNFRNRLPEVGGLQLGIVHGMNDQGKLAALIHPISIAQAIFGSGVNWIQVMNKPNGDIDIIRLRYPEHLDRPRDGVMFSSSRGGRWGGIWVSAMGHEKLISDVMDSWHHPYSAEQIILKIKDMVLNKRFPIPTEVMIEEIAIAEAIRESQKTGKVVRI